MKKVVIIILMVVVGFAADAQTATSKVTPVQKVAASGIQKVSIKDVKAMIDNSTTPLIINFWATWCGPCVREIPYFDSLVATKNSKVKLLLVSLDFPAAYAKELPAFLKKHPYKSEVVFLNETNADYFCPIIDKRWSGAIPASVFVNNKKKYLQFFDTQVTRERLAIEVNKMLE